MIALLYELTGVKGAYSAGLNPFGLTVVLFDGLDASGQSGLWVTNGTAAGTHELTGIKGADPSPSGLNPSDFTVFNNEVLFDGFDSSGERGLWVTNGTVAGTREITGISGAFTGTNGPYARPGGLNPTALLRNVVAQCRALQVSFDPEKPISMIDLDKQLAGKDITARLKLKQSMAMLGLIA